MVVLDPVEIRGDIWAADCEWVVFLLILFFKFNKLCGCCIQHDLVLQLIVLAKYIGLVRCTCFALELCPVVGWTHAPSGVFLAFAV
jgi:hypothetical protein